MSRTIAFNELTLYGRAEHVTYRFESGVNLIVGPVGSGKTSILELLKYTLGGNATLSPAVQESVVSTAVEIALGGHRFIVTRHIGASTVQVRTDDDEPVATYATVAGRSDPPISDALLAALDIPALRVPRSRRRPTGASTRITFFDVYAYLYLNQTEIDRSVVDHLDSYRDPKRRATFELLYGLSNATLLDLEVQRGELQEQVAQQRTRASEILAFLRAAEQPNVDQVRREHEAASAALDAARAQRIRLQSEARVATASAQPLRNRLSGLEEAQVAGRDRISEMSSGIQRLRSLVAQLDLDSSRIDRSLSAGEVFSGLDYSVCPRCLQRVDAHRTDQETCYLCSQPHSSDDAAARLQDERLRIAAQRQETIELIERDQADLSGLRARAEVREGEIGTVREELNTETANYVSPRFTEIEAIGEDLGRLEAQLASLDRARKLWDMFGSIETQIRTLEGEIIRLDAAIEEARGALTEGAQRVSVLSELFTETLERLQLPWLESAHIDAATYLPTVNGRTFEELSSGGMKTLVNDAYHLASLRYTLTHDDSLLPLLQVIDSPRKNFGSGRDDQVLSENLYRRIRALADTFGNRFQLIVADNDAPPIARDFHTLTLSYERPGVPFAEHPGPEHVRSIGAANHSQT